MTAIVGNASVFLTIGLAAMVTYLLRFGGLMLSGRLPQSGRWKRFMDALPGTILLSLIAPAIVSAGLWGGVGALATAVCAYKTKNVLLSMLFGVAMVAVSRQF
jgi:uncharacterized membrane protein